MRSWVAKYVPEANEISGDGMEIESTEELYDKVLTVEVSSRWLEPLSGVLMPSARVSVSAILRPGQARMTLIACSQATLVSRY